jgi:polar amino acid transport system permease protein
MSASTQVLETPILEEIASATRAHRLRFRLIFAGVWIALILVLGLGMWLASGADLDFVFQVGPVIVLQGAGITILLSVASILIATLLAVFGAMGRISRNPAANAVAAFYVSLFRGTPLLVQIYFAYFALPQLGIVLDAIPTGIAALSLNYGAYMSETFRAGIQAVPRGQREAAAALGMPERLIMRRVVLPQAFRIVIPPIGNEFVAMLKDSALVSTITVHETLFMAQRLGRSTFQPTAALLIAAAVYWVLTIIFSYFQEKLEKRMARGDR